MLISRMGLGIGLMVGMCLCAAVDTGEKLSSYPDVALKDMAGQLLWVAGSAESGGDGSRSRPFASINDALARATTENVVVVRAGTYRESLALYHPRKPVPKGIIAFPGERVVVSGMRTVSGWRPFTDKIYRARIDWRPKRLFVGHVKQTRARMPDEGWWRSAQAGKDALTCDAFGGLDFPLADTQAYVWLQHGNTFATLPLSAFDKAAGKATFTIASKWTRLTAGDKLYLENNVAFINRPGEWAWQKAGTGYDVYFYPADRDDLGRVQIPYAERAVVQVTACRDLTLAGLDIVGGKAPGVYATKSSKIRLLWNRAYWNGGNGLSIRDCTDVRVAHNLVWLNGSGVSFHTAKNVDVSKNEIAYNFMDGLLVTWGSERVTAARNYIHHHLFWGHPDNIQMYRGVKQIAFQDNLILAAGQSIMAEQAEDIDLRGNMIVGCGAYMVICGHKNAGKFCFLRNTLAYSGYGCFNLTWKDYDVQHNIFMTGHAGPAFGIKGIQGYTGNHNLFWNARGLARKKVLVSDGGWHDSLSAFQSATGQDGRSVEKEPGFRNGPVRFTVLDSKKLDRCTKDTLHLRGGADGFAAGDHVELNFDGVVRTVQEVNGAAITIAPALRQSPIKSWLVANWKDQRNFGLDLRTGEKATAGARLVIRDYQQGDFTGDGRRDCPSVPEGLQHFIKRFQ